MFFLSFFFFFKQKTAYEMRISDWSSDVCSSDLRTHMPWDGGRAAPAVDDEVVALRLARDGGVDGGLERRVVLAGAQRGAEVGRVLLAEAHVERAGAGQPHPVAGLAEVMRERRDEAEAPAGLGAGPVARAEETRVGKGWGS